MTAVLCPLCGEKLDSTETGLRCPAGHSFDRARQGYVNLLPVSQKHSLHPGDTREQVADRRAFLDEGWYRPIAALVTDIFKKEAPQTVLDVGCGEGYYLSAVRNALPDAELFGMDISKDAVRYAAAREKSVCWLVATAAHLPFPQESFDCLLSMFALTLPEEFSRVLKKGGLFLQVIAHPEHLMGLKQIIYPEIIRKEKLQCEPLPGFILEKTCPLDFSFTLEGNERIRRLFGMTPHAFRIGKLGAERLSKTEVLHDEARIICNLYRKE